jgi:hypothetical protein
MQAGLPALRMYWPKDKNPSIIDGSWKPPAVTRVPLIRECPLARNRAAGNWITGRRLRVRSGRWDNLELRQSQSPLANEGGNELAGPSSRLNFDGKPSELGSLNAWLQPPLRSVMLLSKHGTSYPKAAGDPMARRPSSCYSLFCTLKIR